MTVPSLSGPGYRSGDSGFFEHHGIWAPGVRAFRLLRFNAKAAIISLAFMVPMLVLVGWLLQAHYQQAMQARMDATRQHVEIGHGILAWAHAQEVAGKMPRAQAQQLALQAIAPLRYDGQEYFWINDMEPRMVMHPIRPELDGTEVGQMKDPNGLALFRAFVDTVRQKGKGFVDYQWPKPGGTEPLDKISFVQGFEPWGWVIGSGIYVHDVREGVMHQIRVASIGVLLTLLVAGYLFLCFYRVMDGGLKETRRHLHAMTSGDLTTSPSPWGHDEAAQLMTELRAMQDALRTMVLRVRQSSDEIVHSASEIASGSMDLSRRTEHTASSLEESAASMEEMTATAHSGAENTQQASQMASHNAEVAADGGHVMREVVRTMEGIHASSTQISDIISTIDGIAFQTNILALNAAVEAARAGEQGRGFAVVASEVRSLAGRSAGAAKEIKALIDRSVQQVDTGTAIVRKAGATMEDIVASSQRVNHLLGEIASGAREQNQGIAQIGQAVQELDRMTQQNAALVEETAAAATSMQSQAQTLALEVARFQLPDGMRLAAPGGSHDSAPSERFDFDQAIEAHRQWKVKLRSAIAQHETLDADTLCRDDQCTLGRWLHGNGAARWGSKPLFTQLLDKHADFHQSAGAVAREINAGHYADAEQLIGSGSHFSDISLEVMTLLSTAKRQF